MKLVSLCGWAFSCQVTWIGFVGCLNFPWLEKWSRELEGLICLSCLRNNCNSSSVQPKTNWWRDLLSIYIRWLQGFLPSILLMYVTLNMWGAYPSCKASTNHMCWSFISPIILYKFEVPTWKQFATVKMVMVNLKCCQAFYINMEVFVQSDTIIHLDK